MKHSASCVGALYATTFFAFRKHLFDYLTTYILVSPLSALATIILKRGDVPPLDIGSNHVFT